MTFAYPSHTTKGCVPLSSDVNITGIDDIYLFYGDEKKPDKIYFNKDFSYNTKDCTPTYQHPTTFEDVSNHYAKELNNS